MLYEIKLNVTKPTAEGEEKKVKEHYILDAELHGEAEAAGYQLYPNTDVDVFAVFRSDISEIVNDKEEDKPFFKASVIDIVINDDGSEKEVKYQMLVCAENIVEATSIINEHLSQGYNMRLDGIRRIKINDYLKEVKE